MGYVDVGIKARSFASRQMRFKLKKYKRSKWEKFNRVVERPTFSCKSVKEEGLTAFRLANFL